MITLNVPTLILALVLGFAMLAAELTLAQRGQLGRQPELRSWTRACWAMVGGFLFIGARVVLPESASIVVGNALITLSLLLYAEALHLFLLERGLPRWVWAGFGLAVLLLLLLVGQPLWLRVTLIGLAQSLLLLQSVLLILRHGWRAESQLRMVAVCFGSAAVVLGARSVHAWMHPEQYVQLLVGGNPQGLVFVVAFLFLLGAGFGFVLASFERVAQRLDMLASRDALTGCMNRRTFDALLEHALQRVQRQDGMLGLVLLDLDHFKQINDRHGHLAGDEVLRRVAQTLKARLRGSDVLGRVGGEEFGVLLPETDAAGAQRLAEKLRQDVEALAIAVSPVETVRITLSAGIAVAHKRALPTALTLYGRADQALYAAKDAGRNRVESTGRVAPI